MGSQVHMSETVKSAYPIGHTNQCSPQNAPSKEAKCQLYS